MVTVKILDKGVEIETDHDGRTTVKEKLDIACEDHEEADQLWSKLKRNQDELIQRLKSESV